jgi:hypothetical protein
VFVLPFIPNGRVTLASCNNPFLATNLRYNRLIFIVFSNFALARLGVSPRMGLLRSRGIQV